MELVFREREADDQDKTPKAPLLALSGVSESMYGWPCALCWGAKCPILTVPYQSLYLGLGSGSLAAIARVVNALPMRDPVPSWSG